MPKADTPSAIYATLKEVHTLHRFQLVVHTGNRAELRLIPAEGVSRDAAYAHAAEALKAFLATQGIQDYTCALAVEEPKANPSSGKFKHIVNMTDN